MYFFETSDGVRLNGWCISAQDPIAAILVCHGNAGNISHRLDTIRTFNELNLNVFIFDYRGYGRSSGEITEKGSYLDAEAAYNYLRTRWTKDKIPIVIFGRSLGAAIAIDLATKVNAHALICESGFTSIVEIAQEIYRFLPVRWLCSLQYDSVSKIAKISLPKLIIHSREDEIIPFHHAEKLYRIASSSKEFYALTGSHNHGFLLNEEEYKRKIKDFLLKNVRTSINSS
jgi:hypothetical protein